MSKHITINGKNVSITQEPGVDIETALNCSNFIDWKKNIENDLMLTVKTIHFQGIDMFGKRVGFLKFKSTVFLGDVGPLPGIVFSRGGSVAVLIILECDGEEYTLFCCQPRVPLGSSCVIEPPAGMLDGDGDFAGVCAKEIAEETHLNITKDELINMTEIAYGKKHPGIYSSCGGSDEFITMFLYKKQVSRSEIDELQGKLTGEVGSNEHIKLAVFKLDEVWKFSPDSKTMSLLFLYNQLKSTL